MSKPAWFAQSRLCAFHCSATHMDARHRTLRQRAGKMRNEIAQKTCLEPRLPPACSGLGDRRGASWAGACRQGRGLIRPQSWAGHGRGRLRARARARPPRRAQPRARRPQSAAPAARRAACSRPWSGSPKRRWGWGSG